MTDLLDKQDTDIKPKMAIVLYASEDGYVYLESHEIDEMGRLSAGVALSQQCMDELIEACKKDNTVEKKKEVIKPYGKIPDNLMYVCDRPGYCRYVWYTPPRRQLMYFTDNLNIPDGEYCIPGVLYVTDGMSLDIYAFKGAKPKDKLYKAPFFNTTNGRVCLGNARIKYPDKPSLTDIINYWDKKFWGTKFSHLGGSLNPTKHNLVTVIKKSKAKFDYDELIPTSLTLKQIIG